MINSVERYRELWSKYKHEEGSCESLFEEVLEEVDRLRKLQDNMFLSNEQEIVKLLHDMPWLCTLHGPQGEVGDVFFVLNESQGNVETPYCANPTNNLLEVLREAKNNDWKGVYK